MQANGPSETAETVARTDRGVLVWDIVVRIIHWGLVVSVVGAWLTRELEGDWFAWHTRFGYAVLVLVAVRAPSSTTCALRLRQPASMQATIRSAP
jgi:cytochrome b